MCALVHRLDGEGGRGALSLNGPVQVFSAGGAAFGARVEQRAGGSGSCCCRSFALSCRCRAGGLGGGVHAGCVRDGGAGGAAAAPADCLFRRGRTSRRLPARTPRSDARSEALHHALNAAAWLLSEKAGARESDSQHVLHRAANRAYALAELACAAATEEDWAAEYDAQRKQAGAPSNRATPSCAGHLMLLVPISCCFSPFLHLAPCQPARACAQLSP